MSEKSALHIHTKAAPPPCSSPAPKKKPNFRPDRKRKYGIRNRTLSGTPARHTIVQARPGYSERLLRNSAIACAVLLGILTLGNIDQPWAKKASEGIEKALTMRIDLDDSIGELTFVRELMPESALVFLNISGSDPLTDPVRGELTHPWSELQPWMMYTCVTGAQVNAVDAGTVTAVSPLSDGQSGILVDHGNGHESIYAGLENTIVENGDAVIRGQSLGTAGDQLYFEWQVNGESVDPSELLGD